MDSRHDSTPDDAAQAARTALEQGRLPAATRLLAAALAEDPHRSEWLGLLDEVIAAADDPEQLVTEDELPLSSAQRAVRAYILAGRGRVAEAVLQLLEVVGGRPDVLYLDWALAWLQRPEVAGQLDLDAVGAFLLSMGEQAPALSSPHGGGRETLARLPVFVQLVRRTQPANADFLTTSAGVLARLGHHDEALKLAREAAALAPGYDASTTLAVVHAARGEADAAVAAFREAIRHEPTDLRARLGIADLFAQRGRLAEALEAFAEVLEREPEQATARPSSYYLKLAQTHEESWRDKLLALADDEPDNERAQMLARLVTPFVGFLPEPDDVAALARHPGRSTVEFPSVIAPSNYLAHDWLRGADVTVARIQNPDPRPPRRRVDYLLWKYDGVRPSAALPPPDKAVSAALVQVAAQDFQLTAWWAHTRRLARQLKPEQLDDLLATMVYPPRPAGMERPAAWVYRVQVAAALTVAHIDSGWEDSLRRRALLSLVNGPADWTVDAALVALAAVARDEEEAAPEVARVFRELRTELPNGALVGPWPALFWNNLRLPNLSDAERDEVRGRLERCRDARRAQTLFRQALAHLAERDFDKAAEELTEVVSLDPTHAEAFAERAALLLRRGDARSALTAYTRVVELRPGDAAGYLGRGRVHLKLGQFDPAIEDFSAAVRLDPMGWEAYHRRGLAHTARKNHAAAIADFSQAIRLHPDHSELYLHRALAYTQTGRLDLAIGDYSEQIRLQPDVPAAYNFRARLYARQGRYAAAVLDHSRACELDGANAGTHSQLARLWATCADATVRDGPRALKHATQACELTDWKAAHCLDVLAAAHAACGEFPKAVDWAARAVELATPTERAEYANRLEAYRRGEQPT